MEAVFFSSSLLSSLSIPRAAFTGGFDQHLRHLHLLTYLFLVCRGSCSPDNVTMKGTLLSAQPSSNLAPGASLRRSKRAFNIDKSPVPIEGSAIHEVRNEAVQSEHRDTRSQLLSADTRIMQIHM